MSAGVTIKAFGYISSLLGTSEVTIPCDRQLPLSAILAQLKNNYPSLSQYLPNIIAWRNICSSCVTARNRIWTPSFIRVRK